MNGSRLVVDAHVAVTHRFVRVFLKLQCSDLDFIADSRIEHCLFLHDCLLYHLLKCNFSSLTPPDFLYEHSHEHKINQRLIPRNFVAKFIYFNTFVTGATCVNSYFVYKKIKQIIFSTSIEIAAVQFHGYFFTTTSFIFFLVPPRCKNAWQFTAAINIVLLLCSIERIARNTIWYAVPSVGKQISRYITRCARETSDKVSRHVKI